MALRRGSCNSEFAGCNGCAEVTRATIGGLPAKHAKDVAMSDHATPPQEETTEAKPKKSRAGILKLIKPLAFVGVIVAVEVVAASMLAPSAQETERLAHDFVAASAGHAADHAKDEHGDAHGDHGDSHNVQEVELGVYNITRFNPKTNTTLAIDFELYGVVLASDAPAFTHVYENSQARLREQVVMSLHAATSADLVDAGLGLIKRRILEKTNRALGQPLVREVIFSKFNFVER
jgi:flagellar basal body-associated protein FliL